MTRPVADLTELASYDFGRKRAALAPDDEDGPRERAPFLPPGAPLITQLASYVLRTEGEQLAMRCRLCGLVERGTDVEVHAELRAHHDAEHRGAIVAVNAWHSDHEGGHRPRKRRAARSRRSPAKRSW